MDHNRPSPSEVLLELGGFAFVIGFLSLAAAPFAMPALLFGLLLLPLLLPVLPIAVLYGVSVLVRRSLRARRGSRRSKPRGSAGSAREHDRDVVVPARRVRGAH